jgi:hypothetical protein
MDGYVGKATSRWPGVWVRWHLYRIESIGCAERQRVDDDATGEGHAHAREAEAGNVNLDRLRWGTHALKMELRINLGGSGIIIFIFCDA